MYRHDIWHIRALCRPSRRSPGGPGQYWSASRLAAATASVATLFVGTGLVPAGPASRPTYGRPALATAIHYRTTDARPNTSGLPPGYRKDTIDEPWVPISPAMPAPANAVLPPEWTSVGAPEVINPATAKQIAESYWSRHALAVKERNLSSLAEIESGPALQTDAGTTDCGCEPLSLNSPVALTVFVQRQTSFPAFFFAQAATAPVGKPAQVIVWTVVFDRESIARPWQAVLYSGYSVPFSEIPAGAQVVQSASTDEDGFDVGTFEALAPPVTTLPAQLAAYWQHWRDHDDAPATTTLAPGTWTTEWAPNLTKQKQGGIGLEGLLEHYLYHPGPAKQLWSIPLRGYEMACGVVQEQFILTSPHGGYILQSLSRYPVGCRGLARFVPVDSPDPYQPAMLFCPPERPGYCRWGGPVRRGRGGVRP